MSKVNNTYDISDDGSCIRIKLNNEIVAIVEDYYFAGHVHGAFRQLLNRINWLETEIQMEETSKSPLWHGHR